MFLFLHFQPAGGQDPRSHRGVGLLHDLRGAPPHREKGFDIEKKLYVKTCMHGGNYNWILNSKFGSRNCLAAKDVACNYTTEKKCLALKRKRKGREEPWGRVSASGFSLSFVEFLRS